MFIDNETKLRVNIYAPYKGRSKLDTPEIRAAVGVVEIAEPAPPADFSDDLYYRTEQDAAPYVVYTPKSPEQVKEAMNAKVWAKIDALERQNMFPRQLREFMMEQPGANGKPWFAKIKAVDDEVVALKATLIP